MQVLARGAYEMKGTSKAGKAYEMHILVIEKAQETVANPNMQRRAVGLDQSDLQISKACLEKFLSSGLSWPCRLELVVGHRMGFRGLESVIEDFRVVGSKPVQAA